MKECEVKTGAHLEGGHYPLEHWAQQTYKSTITQIIEMLNVYEALHAIK